MEDIDFETSSRLVQIKYTIRILKRREILAFSNIAASFLKLSHGILEIQPSCSSYKHIQTSIEKKRWHFSVDLPNIEMDLEKYQKYCLINGATKIEVFCLSCTKCVIMASI